MEDLKILVSQVNMLSVNLILKKKKKKEKRKKKKEKRKKKKEETNGSVLSVEE